MSIYCKLCFKEYNDYRILGIHIVKCHNITKEEYYLKYINNNISKCKNCGNKTSFINLNKGFSKFCSRKCANSNSEKIIRWKLNNIKKYGVDNTAKLDTIKEKTKQTCLEKYGYSTPLIVPEQKIKTKEKLIEYYGVDSPVKSDIILSKIQKTCLERYGFTSYSKTEKFRQDTSEFNRTHRFNRSSKYYYNNCWFDSSWELAYYIWLTDNNIMFEYHPNIYFEYEYNNKKYKYYPDFLVNNELYEIKGDHFFDENNNYINPFNKEKNNKAFAKYQCIIKNNVKVLKYKDIAFILNKYGKKYFKQFKV